MTRLLALALIAAAAALQPLPAGHAYNDHDARWTHTALTHGGSLELDPFLDLALSQWSAVSTLSDAGGGADVLIVFGELCCGNVGFADLDTEGETPAGQRIVVRCTITIDPDWWPGRSDERRLAVVLHELGHCLGLGHPNGTTPPQDVAAVMNAPATLAMLQPDDVAGIRALYGQRPGTAVPMLGAD